MAVVTYSSAKGGVGKTTLSVNTGVAFAARGHRTIVLDCDLNQHASQFGETFGAAFPDVPIEFIGRVNNGNILKRIKEASEKAEIVIIDLPAGTSQLALRAMIKSDLVVIPSQKTSLDAKDATRTAFQIGEASELGGHVIHSALVWTNVGAQFETNTERLVREGVLGMLHEPEKAVLRSALLKYDAYPAGFVHGFTPTMVGDYAGQKVILASPNGEDREVLIPKNAKKAADNIASVADDLLERLKKIMAGEDPGRVMLLPEVMESIRAQAETEEAA